MALAAQIAANDPYMELVLAFPLRPIRTVGGHRQALVVLRNLSGKRSSAVRDYKTVLASLVSDYESASKVRWDASKVTAAQIVLHLLEQREMSINALAKKLAISQSSLSDMLNGRREWSKTAIVKMSRFFDLQPALFLR